MPTYEELVAAEQAIRAVLESGAEKRLRAIPGVVHVSVGLKETAGQATDRHAIRVYVKEKIPEDKLSSGERIPREIDGVATDVNATQRFDFARDSTRYRPVKGGIMITNRIIALNAAGTGTKMGIGTFGCTAKRTSDSSIVLLSNWHVLTDNGAVNGDPIFQPGPTAIPTVDVSQLPLKPADDTDQIARILDAQITNKVDAGIARIDLSSCCRCCGIDYRDEINALSVAAHPPSNNILGVRDAVSGATVYKVGITTGRTVGQIVDVNSGPLAGTMNGVNYTLSGQIVISGNDPVIGFSAHGDSGSAVIDDDGYMVGLLFGDNAVPPPARRSYANHIADVCSTLGITINVTTGSQTTAGRRRLPPPVLADVDMANEAYSSARARLLAHPGGKWLWALADEHREEIVTLVSRHRPVTVAWQRAGGPALFASGLKTLRAGGDALPSPADGSTLDATLSRIGDALYVHGSPQLRRALEQHREAMLEAVRGSGTASEVLDKLRASMGSRARELERVGAEP